MTDLSQSLPRARRIGTFPATILARAFADAPAFARLALLLGLSLAVTLLAARIDARILLDEGIWTKPIKFQIALSVYLLTLAVYARWLPAKLKASRGWMIYSGVVVFAIVAEMTWIGGAAALGTGSHFNITTPLMAVLYPIMGLFAVILTSPSLVMGIAVWRNAGTGLSRPVHLALALGLILTFVLTVPVAGYMSNAGGHLVGQAVTGAQVWPMGWSREVGDLRVAHFFAAHALHFLPLGGLVAAMLLPHRLAILAVVAGSVAFGALVGFTFWQALQGQPVFG